VVKAKELALRLYALSLVVVLRVMVVTFTRVSVCCHSVGRGNLMRVSLLSTRERLVHKV